MKKKPNKKQKAKALKAKALNAKALSKSGGGSHNIEDEGVKLLFVGTYTQKRSPTAAKTWNRRAGYSARATGISVTAKPPLGARDIRWADHIFVMEEKHKKRLEENFARFAKHKKIHVLNVADEFKFMDPELVSIFENAVLSIVEAEE
ncbi:MAG: phosphotyrosine protein phosphatase [Pseudomonadota bacterium]|nr:phosphotyrosine protein phosphatase [Pseudomonadota bacterium]